MANANIIRWNLNILSNTISALQREHSDLCTWRDRMKQLQSQVGNNWQSSAGQQYQDRLEADYKTIEHIRTQLERRTRSLTKVYNYYFECESRIRSAANSLPR